MRTSIAQLTVLFVAGSTFLPACGAATSTCPSSERERNFGCAPVQDGAVTYQPDVVTLPAGAGAVRSWSADGVTWVIKGDAQGADQIRRGKVLLVTGLAVGRVLAVNAQESDRAVVLGPVDITDVVRDADVSIAHPVPLTGFLAYTAPALPALGTDVTASSSASTITLPRLRLLASSAPATIPPPGPTPAPLSAGDFKFSASCCAAGA